MTPERLQEIKDAWDDEGLDIWEVIEALEEAWGEIEDLHKTVQAFRDPGSYLQHTKEEMIKACARQIERDCE